MALSVIRLTDLFLPAMRAAGWGRILTLTSTGALQPILVLGISNALRAGLIAWSKSLSNEVARDGTTVNVLMPGRIGTVSGLFFGFVFGMGGVGAAVLGIAADHVGIREVYWICSFLPAIGIVAVFLSNIGQRHA